MERTQVQACVRCGAPVSLQTALCERCNPLGLAQPSASQAHGTVFLALEDETGIANVTIRARDWPRMRAAVRGASLLLVAGRLERTGEVANLVATRIEPLTSAKLRKHARTSFR